MRKPTLHKPRGLGSLAILSFDLSILYHCFGGVIRKISWNSHKKMAGVKVAVLDQVFLVDAP